MAIPGGELFEYILAREHLSENESGRLFAQLIDGIQIYCSFERSYL